MIKDIVAHLEGNVRSSAFYNYVNENTTVQNFPNIIYLCLTNLCNQGCHVCGYPHAMRKGKGNQGFISFDLVKKIVSELPNRPIRLYLIKQGEPLLHPQFPEIIRYIKEMRSDIEIALHSNATKLTRELSQIICDYADFFTISIFATDAETYLATHERRRFDKVIQNIQTFSEIYRATTKKPKIYFDYVDQERNKHESDEQVFNFFAELAPEFNVGIHYTFNCVGFGPEGDMDIFDTLPEDMFPVCTFPWQAFTILWDGKISYCFVEPQEGHFMGDINEDSLLDIWNNDEFRQFRQAHSEHTLSALKAKSIHCQTCNWLWSFKNLYGNKNLFILSSQAVETYLEKVGYHFDNIMTSGEEYLAYGLYMLLKGELGKALEALNISKTVAQQPETGEKATFWIDLISRYFQKFKNVEVWEEHLNREGKTLKTIHNTRYREALGNPENGNVEKITFPIVLELPENLA